MPRVYFLMQTFLVFSCFHAGGFRHPPPVVWWRRDLFLPFLLVLPILSFLSSVSSLDSSFSSSLYIRCFFFTLVVLLLFLTYFC